MATVEILDATGKASPATFALGAVDKILGAPLIVKFDEQAPKVRVSCATNPGPRDCNGSAKRRRPQTASVPVFRNPRRSMRARGCRCRIRRPYASPIAPTCTCPKELRAVMSANNGLDAMAGTGDFHFEMGQADSVVSARDRRR